MKRRLSTSSVEDADEAEDEVDEGGMNEERIKKAGTELKKFENESSIAATIARDLEEKQKKSKLPLHWDPRSASRTASAKKMPHLRCRYETPVNACKLYLFLCSSNALLMQRRLVTLTDRDRGNTLWATKQTRPRLIITSFIVSFYCRVM